MKIEDLTICPALFSCFIAKKLKNGMMSEERKELSENELIDVILWYAKNKLEPNTQSEWKFKNGTTIRLQHINEELKKEENNH